MAFSGNGEHVGTTGDELDGEKEVKLDETRCMVFPFFYRGIAVRMASDDHIQV